MRTAGAFLALLITINITSACTLMSQGRNAEPDLQAANDDTQPGSPLPFEVSDERIENAPIEPDTGGGQAGEAGSRRLTNEVYRTACDGLLASGFQPTTPEGTPETYFKIEVHRADITDEHRFNYVTLRIGVALKAYARNGASSLEGTYQAENERTYPRAPSAQVRARLLDQTMAEALKKLLSDKRLLAHLSKKEPA